MLKMVLYFKRTFISLDPLIGYTATERSNNLICIRRTKSGQFIRIESYEPSYPMILAPSTELHLGLRWALGNTIVNMHFQCVKSRKGEIDCTLT